MKDSDLDIKPDWNNLAQFEPEFHGASIIAADGTEIPMTEQMVQTAFATLISDLETGHGGGPNLKIEDYNQQIPTPTLAT